MHLYNAKSVLTKYTDIKDIFTDFYNVRYELYVKRKAYVERVLKNEMDILFYKVKFIDDVIKDKIILKKQTEDEVIQQLETREYLKLSTNVNASDEEKNYDYITKMALFSLTLNRVEKLKKELEEKKKEYDEYLNMSEKDIWKKEIKEFLTEYNIWLKNVTNEDEENNEKPTSNTKKHRKHTKKK
jgi:DNA topoisomerase-2